MVDERAGGEMFAPSLMSVSESKRTLGELFGSRTVPPCDEIDRLFLIIFIRNSL